MADPSITLKNNPYTAPQYYYPLDLGSEGREPYVIFDIRDSIAKGGTSKGTVALYMPPEVKTSYGAVYDSAETGLLGQSTAGLGQFLEDLPGEVVEAGEQAYNAEYGAVRDKIAGAAQKAWGYTKENAAAMAGASIMANNGAAILQREFGKIVNPHQANLFKGMVFRNFTLNFVLVAKSKEESDMINNIIYTFKYHMHPSYPESGEGVQRYLFYPENFIIGFYSPSPKYLFQISPSNLVNMDVNYAGSGVPSFFGSTGAPTHINLSLSFTETEWLTKQRISEGL